MLILAISGRLDERKNHILFDSETTFLVKNQDIQTQFCSSAPIVEMIGSLTNSSGAAIAVFTKWQVFPEGETKYRIVANTSDNYNGIIRLTARSGRFEAYDTNVSLTQSHNLASDKCALKVAFDEGRVKIDVNDLIKGQQPYWHSATDNHGFEVQYEGIDFEHWIYNPILPPFTT